jgi:hypothetical protein
MKMLALAVALAVLAFLAGGVTTAVFLRAAGPVVVAHPSGQGLLPPGKYPVNRKIGTRQGILATLEYVQISGDGQVRFFVREKNVSGRHYWVKCVFDFPPTRNTVTLANGKNISAVADSCVENPNWHIDNVRPGQSYTGYMTFFNVPGLAKTFTFNDYRFPALSGIRLSR